MFHFISFHGELSADPQYRSSYLLIHTCLGTPRHAKKSSHPAIRERECKLLQQGGLAEGTMQCPSHHAASHCYMCFAMAKLD